MKMRVLLASALMVLGVTAVIMLLATGETGRSGTPDAPAAPAASDDASENASVDGSDPESNAAIRSVPFTSAGDEEAEPPWQLLVSTATGTPVSGAVVIRFRGEDLLDSGRTGPDGALQRAAVDGEADVLVLAAGHAGSRAVLSLGPGTWRMELAAGAAVAGRVLVGGLVPDAPVPLTLSGRHPFPWERGLSGTVRKAHEDARAMGMTIQTVTGPGGTFRFHGLESGWEGFLAPSREFRIATEETWDLSLPVIAPTEDLELRLLQNTLITGRVVHPTDSTPVPHARVGIALYPDEGGGIGTGAVADADGRFRVPVFQVGNWTRLELRAEGPDGTGLRTHLRQGDFSRNQDVGDVPLAAVRELKFRTSDAAGRPIPGMLAMERRWSQNVSLPTGADGRSLLVVPADVQTVWIGGLGREAVQAPIPAAPDEELTVVLAATSVLEIRVEQGDAAGGARLYVRLAADQPLLPESWSDVDTLYTRTGSTYAAVTAAYTALRYEVHEGRVVAGGLASGVPIEVTVADRLTTLARDRVILRPGEHRRLELTLPPARGSVRGTVLGRDGPLEGAVVAVLWGGEVAFGISTDHEGAFVLPEMRVPQISLRATARGHAPRTLEDVPVPERGDGVDLVFEMQAARNLEVVVHDPQGHAVSADEVRVPLGSAGEQPGEELAPGRYRVEDLPATPVTVEVEIAGKTWNVIHDDNTDFCRVEVPAHGSAHMRWDFALELDSRWELLLEPLTGDGVRLVRDVPSAIRKTSYTMDLPALLPGTWRATLLRTDPDPDPATPVAATTFDIQPAQRSQVTLRR